LGHAPNLWRAKTAKKGLARCHRWDRRSNIRGRGRFEPTANRIGWDDHDGRRYRPTGLSAKANRAARLGERGRGHDHGKIADTHGNPPSGLFAATAAHSGRIHEDGIRRANADVLALFPDTRDYGHARVMWKRF